MAARILSGWLLPVLLWADGGGPEPFQIQFPELGDVWLPSGSVIRVPTDPIRGFMVKLRAPDSREFAVEQLEMSLDGNYIRFARLTGQDGHFLKADTREPRGLFADQPHKVTVDAEGRIKLKGWWTITHWDRPYLESVAAGREGAPVEVTVAKPVGGLVQRIGLTKVRVAGKIDGSSGVRLTIDGLVTSRLPGRPGFEFDTEVPVGAGAKPIVLRAVDGAGAETVLILPVAR